MAKSGRCFTEPEESFCGNLRVEGDEECDAGLLGSEDTDACCDENCKLRANAKCSDKVLKEALAYIIKTNLFLGDCLSIVKSFITELSLLYQLRLYGRGLQVSIGQLCYVRGKGDKIRNCVSQATSQTLSCRLSAPVTRLHAPLLAPWRTIPSATSGASAKTASAFLTARRSTYSHACVTQKQTRANGVAGRT